MATIVTRAGKGSPLTNTELDANFTNLNRNLPTKLLLDFGADLAGTWRVLVTATLSAGTPYSTHGFKIQITDPNANHATQGSVTVDEVVYYVACVRTESTVIDTPDLCVVRGPAQHIRAVKTATGTYEIQVQPEAQYREYLITIQTYATNGAHTIVYGDGSAVGGTGTAIYSAAQGSSITWVEKLQAVNTVQGTQLISTVATGTAPLSVSSTTVVANLNADLLDGLNPTTAATGPSIVSRDASGNFSAGTITAALSGAASSNVLKTGDSMTGALSVNVGGGTASANPSITAVNGTNYGVIFVGRNTAGGWNTLSQAGDSAIISQSAGTADGASGLVIGPWSASAKGIRIDSAGDVGIGVSSPDEKLVVAGAITTSGLAAANKTSAGTFDFYPTSNSTRILSWGSAGVGGAISFWTGNGGAGATEKMTLNSSGNLGVGVTPGTWAAAAKAIEFAYPTYGMDGNGAAFMSFNARNSTGSTWVYKSNDEASKFTATNNGAFIWETAPSGTAGNAISFGDPIMTLDASGNLLIATTSAPAYSSKLRVQGGIETFSNQFNASSGTSTPFEFVNRSASAGFDFYVNTGAGSAAARLDGSGNLGLGVTPSAWVSGGNMQLTGNISFQGGFTIASNAYFGSGSVFRYINTGVASFYQQTGGQHLWFNTASGTAGNTLNSASQVMTLDASGRLGIGSAATSPAARLDVAGNQVSNIVAIAALDIDCSLGNYFTKTVNGASTFTVSNIPSSRVFGFLFKMSYTTGVVTWFSGITWPGGAAPVLTGGKTYLFSFVSEGAGSWLANSVEY